MTPTITIQPTPPTAGDQMKLTFEPGKTITLDWDPAGTPTSVVCNSLGEATVVVPSNATSLIASDPSGSTSSVSTTITP